MTPLQLSRAEKASQWISQPLVMSAVVPRFPLDRAVTQFGLGTLEKAATLKHSELRVGLEPRRSLSHSSDSLAHFRPQFLHCIASSSARGMDMPRRLLTNVHEVWQRGQSVRGRPRTKNPISKPPTQSQVAVATHAWPRTKMAKSTSANIPNLIRRASRSRR